MKPHTEIVTRLWAIFIVIFLNETKCQNMVKVKGWEGLIALLLIFAFSFVASAFTFYLMDAIKKWWRE